MGNYSVPEEIRKFKPKGKMVKVVNGQYYVYNYKNVKDEKGKWKIKMGGIVGKITLENGFIPNGSMINDSPDIIEYGQYKIILDLTSNIYNLLEQFFDKKDAMAIYNLAIIHFVNDFTFIKNVKSFYEMSYLSIKYPTLNMGYNSLCTLLTNLGCKTRRVRAFEQYLIDNSSKKIAIDGHDIKSYSNENDLAENGNKYQTFKSPQMNVLMAYDINTNTPLASKTYDGSTLDKTSIKDFLELYSFNNTLFIIDAGFYSNENIKLFSQNNCKYIVPLSRNLKEYKEVTASMDLKDNFVYEASNKKTVIEYNIYSKNDKKIYVFRDLTQSVFDKSDYLKNMAIEPKKYTQEKYDEVKDFFGTIVLVSNYDVSPQEIFKLYKQRWKIETFFNYYKNGVQYNNIHFEDYYKTQGLSFIMLIVGLIYKEVMDQIKKINGLSLNDLLLKGRFIKASKKGDYWYLANIKKDTKCILDTLNISIENKFKF